MYLLPSPHISDHMSFVDEFPPEHVQPVSKEQLESHPSPFDVLPSSQKVLVLLNFLQSPHISKQVSFRLVVPPEHFHPVSMFQADEHPSPSIRLWSSQYVKFELNLLPSPHISVQTSGVVIVPPIQFHPLSIWQWALHPSFEYKFPSSQWLESNLAVFPSPHISQVSAFTVFPPYQP